MTGYEFKGPGIKRNIILASGNEHDMDETELQILNLLAREWKFKGPPGILDVSDIVAALPTAPSDILEALKSLFELGLVDMNSLKTSAFLTPEGYEAAGEDNSYRDHT